MILGLALWVSMAAIAAFGSYHFAQRDSHAESWTKLVVVAALGISFATALMIWKWSGDSLGEGWTAYIVLFVALPISIVGTPICIGWIIGTSIVLYRNKRSKP